MSQFGGHCRVSLIFSTFEEKNHKGNNANHLIVRRVQAEREGTGLDKEGWRTSLHQMPNDPTRKQETRLKACLKRPLVGGVYHQKRSPSVKGKATAQHTAMLPPNRDPKPSPSQTWGPRGVPKQHFTSVRLPFPLPPCTHDFSFPYLGPSFPGHTCGAFTDII